MNQKVQKAAHLCKVLLKINSLTRFLKKFEILDITNIVQKMFNNSENLSIMVYFILLLNFGTDFAI